MKEKTRPVVCWFRRDLRADDNRALCAAAGSHGKILPLFIFDDEILKEHGAFDGRLRFIAGAVMNLSKELEKKGAKLACFRGRTYDIFRDIAERVNPSAVYCAKSLTWSGERISAVVASICREKGSELVEVEDGVLTPVEKIGFRKVFTPFYKQWVRSLDIKPCGELSSINAFSHDLPGIGEIIGGIEPSEKVPFDPRGARARLESLDLSSYGEFRDRPDIDATGRLSPHIRFGTISVREIFREAAKKGGEDNQFVKELAWREFWYHIKHNFQGFRETEFQEKRRNLRWRNDEKLFSAFREGRTGYPLVDAGIRQLVSEKWVHGRVRMVLASFLTKDLLVDWRLGEKFFKEHLLDYDEVVNTGNWQWCASVGPDPKPLRIFNPCIQSAKFDPGCRYIKKHLPELKKVPPENIHDPLNGRLPWHPPVIDHGEAAKKARAAYKGL